MNDRDTFAAAALTGLLAQGDDGSFSEESYARGAYRWADAMLRCRGTGDTPATHATHGEGSERRECTEPVAWGVAGSKGLLYATSVSRMDAVDMQSEHECETHVVPLYRSPTLTDAERGAIEWLTAGESPFAEEEARLRVLRGLLERLGGER
jgi:hypothetical protein